MSRLCALPNYGLIPPYMLQKIIKNNSDASSEITSSLLADINRMLIEDLQKNELITAKHKSLIALLPEKGKILRSISDAENGTFLNKFILRDGEASIHDIAANEVYDYLGITYDFFWQKFQRYSLDNKGLQLKASINYHDDSPLNRYINTYSYWLGKDEKTESTGQCVVFGHSNGQIFNRLTAFIDIVARQLTYGIIESEADFIYDAESGALTESISDVFGSMVKQFYKNQTAEKADWLIGEGLLNNNIHAKGLRSLARPGSAYNDPLLGKDPQPAHMNGYININSNNNGIYANSGIPNRAFYLAAIQLGGYSWERAGKIWYCALCDESLKQQKKEGNKVGFLEFSRVTINNACRLFGQHTADKVRNAWYKVGVKEPAHL